MEDLSSDVRMELAKYLKGDDILSLCQSSKTMKKICLDERYDPLWWQKIEEEYQITYRGSAAAKKYEELRKLYTKTFYIVTYRNQDNNADPWLQIFDTREKAVEYIAKDVVSYSYQGNYFLIRWIADKADEGNDSFEIGSDIYEIQKKSLVSLNDVNEKYLEISKKNYKEEYERLLNILDDKVGAEIVSELDDLIIQMLALNSFGYDLTELDETQTEYVNTRIKDFCESMNIEDVCNDVKNYVYFALLRK